MTERTGAVMASSQVDLSLQQLGDTQEQPQTGHMGQREVRSVKTDKVTHGQLCFAFTVVIAVGFCLFAMTLHMGNGPTSPWLRKILGFDNGTNSN